MTRIPVAWGYSTVLPDMDFEAYSEAGFVWADGKWVAPEGATKKGIGAVGSAVYAQHPSTEVLSLAYNLKDGKGDRLWVPGCPPPTDLFGHLANGGLIEAWNCAFEYHIWNEVCVKRYGWPALDYMRMRDAMAKARAFALPGALGKAAEVLNAPVQKLEEGKRLLNKFSMPRKPTKKNPALRIRPEEDMEDAMKLYEYNIVDIHAEAAVSAMLPDLQPEEEEFWLHTQACNYRGLGVRPDEVQACADILNAAYAQYNGELAELTGGTVKEASKVQQLIAWADGAGYRMSNLDDAAINAALDDPACPPKVKRALEIRQMIGSAGVKKVFAMKRMATRENRICDLFNYHGARTGRDTGSDVQPQNLVKAGPKLYWCDECGKPSGTHNIACPHCSASLLHCESKDWSWEAVAPTLEVVKTGSLDFVEVVFGNAVLAVSGCVRGLFTAAPGKEFICSDYSAIEAVVAAALAGEEWRLDVFRQKKQIYLMSASAITGTTYEEYEAYKEQHGHHHPDRQKIGKVAELALGYAGWITAWRNFDKSDNYSDPEVKQLIVKWRDASPAIVEMWGGQVRGKPWAPEYQEYYGLEGAAIKAVLDPGRAYWCRSIAYQVKDDILYCRLPSGRFLTYHKPRLAPSSRWEGQYELSFEGYNTNPTMGPIGWIRINTFGGRLFENVDQAVARDILRDAVNRLERAGYPIVLRVHDELVAEVPKGWGSIEEFEELMGQMPEWAKDWPVRAAGGWRGDRYRKD
jgi:DNA polymerase